MTVVEVPLHGERVAGEHQPPEPLRSRRAPLARPGLRDVSRRTASAGGWSAWRAAAPEADDLPDRGSAEARAAGGWHLGSPWWVGAVRPDRVPAARRRSAAAGVPRREPGGGEPERCEHGRGASRTLSSAALPSIVTRAGWNADESIRQSPPQYAATLGFAVIHHTAGANAYTQEEAPAVVRAIELYHVKGNGWNDIGYNFLVDRFGTVYEGRYGGVDRNVVGAHALGFNRGSVGIAVLGTYIDAPPPPGGDRRARPSARVAPRPGPRRPCSPSVSVVSGGSERYPAGTPVVLRAVSGHSDTGLTACPGRPLYARLAALRPKAQSIGLPKIYAPRRVGPARRRWSASRRRSRARARGRWPLPTRPERSWRAGAESGQHRRLDAGTPRLRPPARYSWQIACTVRRRRPAISARRLLCRRRWSSPRRRPSRRRSAPTATVWRTRRRSRTRRRRLRP